LVYFHIFYVFYILKINIFLWKYNLYKLNHIVHIVYPRVVRIIKSQPFHVNLYHCPCIFKSCANYQIPTISCKPLFSPQDTRQDQFMLVERSDSRFFTIVFKQICVRFPRLHSQGWLVVSFSRCAHWPTVLSDARQTARQAAG